MKHNQTGEATILQFPLMAAPNPDAGAQTFDELMTQVNDPSAVESIESQTTTPEAKLEVVSTSQPAPEVKRIDSYMPSRADATAPKSFSAERRTKTLKALAVGSSIIAGLMLVNKVGGLEHVPSDGTSVEQMTNDSNNFHEQQQMTSEYLRNKK